ncbi:putative pinoresinol-lariciresinol reductase 3 [Zostera marina]|uniref:Putative pinoresinol-lariciresinol reductase 3 n=1 Tax=Zostera marina TaxID=29655 RepID=A0A0K9P4V0_ZOSMR|nr:putative pinoresinol-lariciresinol reductase 3 [Zostera marina]
MEKEAKSRILVVGATGNLGKLLVRSSVSAGHSTFVLARDSAFYDRFKAKLLHSFAADGVTVLKGSLEDHGSMIEAIKMVDVVISAVSLKQVLDQKLLILAIKEAGCIKRFIPAEFGVDADKVQVIGMDYEFYEKKIEIRRFIENLDIPHTYICCNLFTRILLPNLVQQNPFKIFGDGNTKGVFVEDRDVANFTICTVDDSRSLNKTLHLRPNGNFCTMNDIVNMWEIRIGKKLEKEYVSEDQLLKNIQEIPYPKNMELIFIYSAFIKGDHTYFPIDSSSGLEGTEAYPSVKLTTVHEFINTLPL